MIDSDSLNRGAAPPTSNHWPFLTAFLAMVGTAGSLWLSIAMKLKACPLCFYQRSFVMSVLAVLAMGFWVDRSRRGLACLLVLPLVFGGLAIAAYHEYLVISGVLECPPALFGLGTAPLQSLTLFLLLSATSTFAALEPRTGPDARGWFPVIGALVIGIAMAWGCIASSPPLPPIPGQPYNPEKQPLDICRPPFQGAKS